MFYVQLGNLDEAEKLYNEIIALNPISKRAYGNKGVTLYELCRFHEAETIF